MGVSGAVVGNRWWGSLKYRIKDFVIKYCHKLRLDRAKKAKALEDWLFRAVEGIDSLGLVWRDLERKASERYVTRDLQLVLG